MPNKKPVKKLITHNGSFHADDVFAAATLSLLLEKKGEKFKIIRTRDEEIIKTGDYVFDVGGVYNFSKNRFDHHQRTFKEKRKNGITYSSVGLIWKKFGKEVCGNEDAKNYIDEILIEQIDAKDNGMNIFKPLTSHKFFYDVSSVIASFSPVWGEKQTMVHFKNAVKLAKAILKKEIAQHKSLLLVKDTIDKEYTKSKNKKLLILNIDIPRYLLSFITIGYSKLLYVVFKDEKNWKLMAMRKSDDGFKNKKDLPKSWAGLRDKELQKITGVKDAVFCHKKLFMAVARSKEGAIALARKALVESS